VGTVIADKYRVEGLIGSGGMGLVVAAQHLHLGGRVALKVLTPAGVTQEGLVKRFFQEARLASRIQSEHVVRVLDVGMLPGAVPFIVMEYLEGDDLRTVLKKRVTLSVEDAIDYTLQAMEAVAEAHALGIVHRDLKPQNLFLTNRADGSALVKVLDFGISKALSSTEQEESALTHTRGMLGSPLYVSPEQIRSAKHVDVRSDLWSLGVILYEFLSGQPPFRGDTMPAVLAAVISDAPGPLGRGVPPELERVVMRCLAKAPDGRFSSARELADELVHFGGPGARLSWERIRGVLARSAMPSFSSEGQGLPAPVSIVAGGGPHQTPLPLPGGESVLELSSAAESLLTFSTSHQRAVPGLDPLARPPAPGTLARSASHHGRPSPRPPSPSSPSSHGGRPSPSSPSFHDMRAPSPSSPSFHGPQPPSPSSPSFHGARPSSMPPVSGPRAAGERDGRPSQLPQPPQLPPPLSPFSPPGAGGSPFAPPGALPAGGAPQLFLPPEGAPPAAAGATSERLSVPHGPADASSAHRASLLSMPHVTSGAWRAVDSMRSPRRMPALAAVLGGGVVLGTLVASLALTRGGKGDRHPAAGGGSDGAITSVAATVPPGDPPRPAVSIAPPPAVPPVPPEVPPATSTDEPEAPAPGPAGKGGKGRPPPRGGGAKGGGRPPGTPIESLFNSRK
jgi:serine/threonine-protein kinase